MAALAQRDINRTTVTSLLTKVGSDKLDNLQHKEGGDKSADIELRVCGNAGQLLKVTVQHAPRDHSTILTVLLPSYILRTASGRTDGRDVYGVTVGPPMTFLLPTTGNYIGDCRRRAVPTLGPEGGVWSSPWAGPGVAPPAPPKPMGSR
jgi:hypothetical protein